MFNFNKPRGLKPHAWVLTGFLRKFVLRPLAKSKVFKVKVTGIGNIPAKGRAIIACNHVSISDPVYIWGAVRGRRVVAIAMAELWKMPGLNLFMWLLGMIPIKRGNAESGKLAVAKGQKQLEHEGLLLIFPQGKCTDPSELGRFYPGVANLAASSHAPVIPTGIVGSNLVKPLRTKWWHVNREHEVIVRFGEPLYISDFAGEADPAEAFLSALRVQILKLMLA